MRITFNAFNT
jgi:hypothetical protein